MAHRPLRLLGTHWETPDLARAGWVEREYLLDRAQTGFVALHLWNVGEPGGPAIPERFFVDMGSREATLAVEYPDTFPERLMTRSALRYFQQVIGDTLSLAQFLEACR